MASLWGTEAAATGSANMVWVADARVAEGNAGTTGLTFELRLTNPNGSKVTVDFKTVDGTAKAPGDYTAQDSRVVFAPGTTKVTVTVPVVGDTTVEPDESLSLKVTKVSGGVTGDGTGAGTIINDDSPPPTNHLLTVGKAGNGQGVVTSSPPGIDCGADCTQSYAAGTPVTLSAQASAGSQFTGWSGACSGTAACQVLMDQARSVTATFGLAPTPTYTLSILKFGAGQGTVTSSPTGIDCGADCEQAYTSGTTVTLTATPGPSSTFHSWSGACSGSTPTCSVLMDQNKSVTAGFAAQTSTLTVTATSAERGSTSFPMDYANGRVSSDPAGIDCSDKGTNGIDQAYPPGQAADCTETYSPDTTVTLTAQALPVRVPLGNDGLTYMDSSEPSKFLGWGGACSLRLQQPTCTLSMSQARNVTASFGFHAPATLNVTVSNTSRTNPTAGFFTDYSNGRVISDGVGIDCAAPSTLLGPYPPDQVSDCTQQYQGHLVTLTAQPLRVRRGSILGYDEDPAELSVFTGWGGACADRGTLPTCTVTMDQARTVSAAFYVRVYKDLTVTVNTVSRPNGAPIGGVDWSNGRVTSTPAGINCAQPGTITSPYPFGQVADCQEFLLEDTMVTLVAQPLPIRQGGALGFSNSTTYSRFTGWGGACVLHFTEPTCTVTMNQARQVTANFGF